MNRIARDGIFSFVIAGMIGLYAYLLGVNAPDRKRRETITVKMTDKDEDGDSEEELDNEI